MCGGIRRTWYGNGTTSLVTFMGKAKTNKGPRDELATLTRQVLDDLSEALDLLKEEGDEAMLRRVIRPMEDALGLLPKIWVRDSAVDALCNGAALAMPGVLRLSSGIEKGSMVAVLTQRGEAVALMGAEASTEEIAGAEKGLAAEPLRVIMRRGTYPRMWGSG